jgi:hypothetical protein
MGNARQPVLFLAGSLLWGLPAVAFGQDDATRALVGSLGSEEFKARAQAQRDLSKWALDHPEPAQEWLLAELDAAKDPEIRLRLRDVLAEVVIAGHQKDGPGYVGINMDDVQVMVPGEADLRAGVKIVRTVKESPATRAGLLAGDVIVSLDQLRWNGDSATLAFAEAIKKYKPGATVELGILRNAELKKIPVTLAPRPMGLPEARVVPGIPLNFNFIQPMDEAELEAMEKEAKAAYFEAWLAQRRARAGKR